MSNSWTLALALTSSQRAIKLSEQYPEAANKVKSAHSYSKHPKAITDTLDQITIAALSKLKEDPEAKDIVRGDSVIDNFPLVPKAKNPYFQPSPFFEHIVVATAGIPEGLGRGLVSNVDITNHGSAMLKWTYDGATLRQMMRTIGILQNHGLASVSCLRSLADPEQPVPALTTPAGKEMREAWNAIESITPLERQMPYNLDKRYDTKTFSPQTARKLIQAIELLGFTNQHNTEVVDKILASHYQPRNFKILYPLLEAARLRIVHITRQWEKLFGLTLPRGLDGTPLPFLGDDASSWNIYKMNMGFTKHGRFEYLFSAPCL